MDKKTLKHKVELACDAHTKMAEMFGSTPDEKTTKIYTKHEHHRRVSEILKEILSWMNK